MGRNAGTNIASCSWDHAIENLVQIWQDQITKKKSEKELCP
jgi:hypothetical protein